MVKIVGENSGLIASAVRRLFRKLPGWLRMPLLGKAKSPEKTAIPDRLSQRDIYKVFYLLLKQAGGKIAMYQETIDDVDGDFVKDFVFCQEQSLNGQGPGWVIGLQSCETERVGRIRKRARRRSTKRLTNRKKGPIKNQGKQNIKLTDHVTEDSEIKAKEDAARAIQDIQFNGITGNGPDKK